MRRVVITGLGAATTLGLELSDIEDTLRKGTSCITYCPEFEEHGFKSRVAGWLSDWDATQFFDRKSLKIMGNLSAKLADNRHRDSSQPHTNGR